jgi:uncharacterized repeat protein (TIGR03803 family)
MDTFATSWGQCSITRRLGLFVIALSAGMGVGAASPDKFKALHVFSGADGSTPYSPLLLAADGKLYGTTNGGGADPTCTAGYVRGCGTVFEMTPSGKLQVLHSFAHDGQDATNPIGPLAQAPDGTIYGTSMGGGSADQGTIFAIAPDGTESVVQTFDCTSTGACHPYGGLMIASDGNLYGTTVNGGGNNFGTVFRWSPGGGLVLICLFPGDGSFGRYPDSVPVEGPDHDLYVTGEGGLGASVHGTIIRLAKDGSDTSLWYVFGTQGMQTGGDSPQSPVAFDANGTMYGMTYAGGQFNLGTAWSLSADGQMFKLLHSFADKKDGSYPVSGFAWSPDGQLVGATDGVSTNGSVIEMTTDGALTVLHVFSKPPLGLPYYNPIVTASGVIYGTTAIGTPQSNDGGVYRLTPKGADR